MDQTHHSNRDNTYTDALIVFKHFPEEGDRRKIEIQCLAQGDYITAKEFCHCMSAAIKSDCRCCYLHRYLTPELLFIDEAEYFTDKDTTQQELHTILKQRVDAMKKTIVISKHTVAHLSNAIHDDLLPFLAIENA